MTLHYRHRKYIRTYDEQMLVQVCLFVCFVFLCVKLKTLFCTQIILGFGLAREQPVCKTECEEIITFFDLFTRSFKVKFNNKPKCFALMHYFLLCTAAVVGLCVYIIGIQL